MTGNLFKDLALPAPGPKRLTFKRPEHPIWTENKAKLIERYLYYFVLVAKHGAYIDGFAAPQAEGKPESWAAKLVLESKPAFLREFWLCDVTSKGVAALRELKRAQPNIPGRTIDVLEGDFNTILADILVSAAELRKARQPFVCWTSGPSNANGALSSGSRNTRPAARLSYFIFLGPDGWTDRSRRRGMRKGFCGGGVEMTGNVCSRVPPGTGQRYSATASRMNSGTPTRIPGRSTARTLAAV
jgi:hypothetical protein